MRFKKSFIGFLVAASAIVPASVALAGPDDVPPGQCKRLPNEQAGCPVIPPGQCDELPPGQQKQC